MERRSQEEEEEEEEDKMSGRREYPSRSGTSIPPLHIAIEAVRSNNADLRIPTLRSYWREKREMKGGVERGIRKGGGT